MNVKQATGNILSGNEYVSSETGRTLCPLLRLFQFQSKFPLLKLRLYAFPVSLSLGVPLQ